MHIKSASKRTPLYYSCWHVRNVPTAVVDAGLLHSDGIGIPNILCIVPLKYKDIYSRLLTVYGYNVVISRVEPNAFKNLIKTINSGVLLCIYTVE